MQREECPPLWSYSEVLNWILSMLQTFVIEKKIFIIIPIRYTEIYHRHKIGKFGVASHSRKEKSWIQTWESENKNLIWSLKDSSTMTSILWNWASKITNLGNCRISTYIEQGPKNGKLPQHNNTYNSSQTKKTTPTTFKQILCQILNKCFLVKTQTQL